MLDVCGLTIGFSPGQVIVQDLTFAVSAGTITAIVGQSGAGKSMTALAIARLLPPTASIRANQILFDGINLMNLPDPAFDKLRGRRIGFIFQDSSLAFNPLMRIGDQLAEATEARSSRERGDRAVGLLSEVGFDQPGKIAASFPHQLSGGMRQRVLVAMALAGEPDLVIADEPTASLDAISRRHVLDVLLARANDKQTAFLLITHDLDGVAAIADRMIVMHQGQLVEMGSYETVTRSPQHPQTMRLLTSCLGRRPAVDRAKCARVSPPLIEATGLTVSVFNRVWRFGSRRGRASVDDVSLTIPTGAVVGLIGESGSGKTTLARILARLSVPDKGTLRFGGENALALTGEALRIWRRRVQIVSQAPISAFDPRRTIAHALQEVIKLRSTGASVGETLERVGLFPYLADRKPNELSGGQLQRVAIARALISEPELLICDEPTSALDLTSQAQILDLLQTLNRTGGLTLIVMSHDLSVIRHVATHVGVLHRGKLVEWGTADAVFDNPTDPYARSLIATEFIAR